ncbi:RsmB/NOP family class I SAM-dependent RNA methyltransferase [Pedobacter sandarakinus]|uniref:RsmB/NOP family class I SAM-dependent RNA methyltransferase n=1 Tax=Pedobacter sandarakinus TaxID=353156 RepID=UPI0022484773|nr:RsmB/NOP family class I SAM-dependent RNA methyltransferase [Pedobacter sandarakinus]MCX2572904.1 RsmB/NOP family class I SAM-dependent RNA methyltransferase [Pedobacter sandarakinus]
MKATHQLRAFELIADAYDGKLPLHRFLPTYFKQNKQMGSADRRWATRHLYSFFRLGTALKNLDSNERLCIADFLCHDTLSPIVAAFYPDWSDKILLPLHRKIELITERYPDFRFEDIYPFQSYLSESIHKETFNASFFAQPDLFIRVMPGIKDEALQQLSHAEIDARALTDTALALPNGTKLESILKDGTYQVQDLSSQFTGTYFKPQKWDKWWDACAASGGKSLLLNSLESNIELLVTDLRESVLQNLDERFRLAGIRKYHKKELDLLKNNDQILHHYQFDGIILDAPCTGSGTWGRTPEMLTFFDETKIEYFASIQKAIATNVCKYLKPGKPLIYITCSAFAQENEQVVVHLLQHLPLTLEKMEVVKGYEHRADTMFVARLIMN